MVASLGVLLSLVVGVSRTAFSMAANRDLPGFFAAVHPRYRVPHRAELGVGILVALTVGFVDLRSAIGVSAFTVLTYYAVTNASAFTLKGSERRWPRWVAFAGLAGCAIMAFTLPLQSILPAPPFWPQGRLSFYCGQDIPPQKTMSPDNPPTDINNGARAEDKLCLIDHEKTGQ